jgi:hypothetical protein
MAQAPHSPIDGYAVVFIVAILAIGTLLVAWEKAKQSPVRLTGKEWLTLVYFSVLVASLITLVWTAVMIRSDNDQSPKDAAEQPKS